VVRSPTRAELPSGIGARPHGVVRQVAMTASSVGAHGSAGAWDPLGGGLAGTEPLGLGEGDGDGRPGVLWSGSAARAVSDGCTVKVDASLEKSAHPAVSVTSTAHSTAGTRRCRACGDRALGEGFEMTGFEENIAINGTGPAVSPPVPGRAGGDDRAALPVDRLRATASGRPGPPGSAPWPTGRRRTAS